MSGIRVAIRPVASATIAVVGDCTSRMTVELRNYLAVAVSLLHASDIWLVAHPIIRSCNGGGGRADGRNDHGCSRDGEEPSAKCSHVRDPKSDSTIAYLCQYIGSSLG